MTVEIILTSETSVLKIELEKRLSELSKNNIEPKIHYSMSDAERGPSFSVLLEY